MLIKCYDLAGLQFEVIATDAAYIEAMDLYLASLSSLDTGTEAKGAFRLTISAGHALELPEGAHILHRGPVFDDPDVSFALQGARRIVLIPGKGMIEIDIGGRTATMTIHPGMASAVRGILGMHAIDSALEAGGQILLHGAAMTLPDRSGGFILHAPSGTGKTTATLQLAFAGYGLYSDDIAVIRPSHAGAELWGLPRHLKIHRRTADLDPRFAALVGDEWNNDGEQSVPRATLEADVRVEPADPVPLKAFIHLVRDDGTMAGPTALRHLARPDALVALAADNIRTGTDGVPGFERARMAILSAYIRDTPTFECRIGRDLDGLPQLIAAALAGSVESPPAPPLTGHRNDSRQEAVR